MLTFTWLWFTFCHYFQFEYAKSITQILTEFIRCCDLRSSTLIPALTWLLVCKLKVMCNFLFLSTTQGLKQHDRYSLQPEDKVSLSVLKRLVISCYCSNIKVTITHWNTEHAIVQVLSCVQRFMEWLSKILHHREIFKLI